MLADLELHSKLHVGSDHSSELPQQSGYHLAVPHRCAEWNVAPGGDDRAGLQRRARRTWIGFRSVSGGYSTRRAVCGVADQSADDQRFLEGLGLHLDL